MKVKLITTVSDVNNPGWLRLKYSLEKFGWDYEPLVTEYAQFGTKMVNAYNYAKSTDCTHLFIVDAYDVLAFGTMKDALGRIGCKSAVLFNAERNAWPYEQWGLLYPECKSSFKYLNGGMAFVEVSRFIEMFEDNPITIYDNDQVLLAKIFLTNNKYDIELDTNCNVFQTLCGTNWDEFDGLENKETGTSPILWHGNGKHPMNRLIDML